MRLVHAVVLLTLAACRENPSNLSAESDAGPTSPSSPSSEGDVSQRLMKVLSRAYPAIAMP